MSDRPLQGTPQEQPTNETPSTGYADLTGRGYVSGTSFLDVTTGSANYLTTVSGAVAETDVVAEAKVADLDGQIATLDKKLDILLARAGLL